MRTIFLFTGVTIIDSKGFYAFAAIENAETRKPLYFQQGEIPEVFCYGPNMAALYAMTSANYFVSGAIKKALNGIPFRLIVVSRNKNACSWFNAPGKYINRHAHKSDRIAGAFKYCVDAQLDPIARSSALCASSHPAKRKNEGRAPNELLDLSTSIWEKFNLKNCERLLRDIHACAETEYYNKTGTKYY